MAKVIETQKNKRNKIPQNIDPAIRNSSRDAEKKDGFYGYLIFGLSALTIILIWILINYH